MRICYLPQDLNASGMYRLVFPFRELEKNGHWARTPFYRTVRDPASGFDFHVFELDRLPAADVYVFQSPLDANIVPLVGALRRRGHVTVAEADDTSLNLPEWHPAYAGTHPATNPFRNRDHRHSIYRACDAMTVSTPALAEQYARHNATIRVLPNFLLGEMWANVTPQYTVERERVRVGWMGRSLWRQGDLDVLKPWLGDWLRAHPDVDFVAAGDEAVHDILGVPEAQRVSYPAVRFPVGLAEITATMDVGLVPLSAHPFNEAKSCLKGMEYAACGIPCVASPTVEYRRWLDNDNGLLASSSEDWVAALDRLVSDASLRRSMGRAAEAKAASCTIDRHAHLWEELYEWLIERKQRQASTRPGRSPSSAPASKPRPVWEKTRIPA